MSAEFCHKCWKTSSSPGGRKIMAIPVIKYRHVTRQQISGYIWLTRVWLSGLEDELVVSCGCLGGKTDNDTYQRVRRDGTSWGAWCIVHLLGPFCGRWSVCRNTHFLYNIYIASEGTSWQNSISWKMPTCGIIWGVLVWYTEVLDSGSTRTKRASTLYGIW